MQLRSRGVPSAVAANRADAVKELFSQSFATFSTRFLDQKVPPPTPEKA